MLREVVFCHQFTPIPVTGSHLMQLNSSHCFFKQIREESRINRCIFRGISPIIVSNFNKFLPVVFYTYTLELFGRTKYRLSRYLCNTGWTYNANPLVNNYSVHHACFPFPAPTVQGPPPRRGKWDGVPSQLMFWWRHDQAPNQKHGIEDTPRDYTRDASHIFGS